MSPHEPQTRRRSPAGERLATRWDHYLDSRGPRAHGDLLKEIDGHVRTEASRILGPGHPMLEEVSQEALVGAAKRISSGERPDFPLAYLRKIVHNKVADMLRREAARVDREQQHWTPDVGEADASMSAEWHDFLDTLRDIVSSDEFWTLILHYHFDYSYGEIGHLLDKEANAVRQIAHRGRRKCREHLTRLEGRVPAWVLLPDAGPESGGRVAESTAGDQPGLREPRKPDPADRSRRPSAGSESVAVVPSPPIAPPRPPTPSGPSSSGPGPAVSPSRWRRRPRLRPDGPGRAFGNPTTVVPLVLLVALPLLFQVDRALDATVARPTIQTARLVDGTDGAAVTRPPSGPTISVTTSTAPTARREAPSTSAPPPDSSDPPTTSTETTAVSTTVNLSTTGGAGPSSTRPPSTAATTTAAPPPRRPVTTRRSTTTSSSTTVTSRPTTAKPTTTTATTTQRSTTVPSSAASSSSTGTAPPTTTTTAPTTTATTARTTTTATTTPTTATPTSTAPTRPTSSSSSTSGRDPGDGNDPPPNE